MGKELYEEQIERILKEEDSEVRNAKLDELLENSNYDHYVVSRIAEYRYENKEPGVLDLLSKLENGKEYECATTYFQALDYEKAGELEKAIECIESITRFNGYFCEKARELYPKLLYLDQDYKNVICFFNYSRRYGLLNHSTYYYAAKVCFKKNPLLATMYVENAIDMKPDIIEYHTFLKFLYVESRQYSKALEEIEELLSLNIDDDLRNKLNLGKPHLLMSENKYREALEQIKVNKENGLTDAVQESAYVKMGSHYGDYNGAEKSAIYLINSKKIQPDDSSALLRMYCVENLCDKAISTYETLNDSQKVHSEVTYSKACALVQKGEHLEAKELISSIPDEDDKPRYKRLEAYCLYLEGKYDDARHIIEKLPCDATKIDIFLRYKLGILDLSKYNVKPEYARVLLNYNFNAVYDLAKNKYGESKFEKAVRINQDVNLGRFVHYMSYAIDGMEPNYTLYRDVYLVDYGVNVATINKIPTSHFVVEAIQNGPLIDLKPVIPTEDAIGSYQRVRVGLTDGIFKRKSEGD